MTVTLFIPCFVDLMYPRVGISIVQILEKLGHKSTIRKISPAADNRRSIPVIGRKRAMWRGRFCTDCVMPKQWSSLRFVRRDDQSFLPTTVRGY